MNVNKKVVTYTTGFTKDKKLDKQIPAGVFYRQHVLVENSNMIDERVKAKEEDYQKNTVLQKIAESKIGKDKIRHMNTMHQTGKNILLSDIMFEMFQNALLLDQSFISENSVSLKSYLDEYLSDRGGFTLLENAIEDTNSNLLKSIKKLCEATATKVCNRKISEDSDYVSIFNVNDDEKDEFMNGKNDMDMTNLSDLVKQKVLTVVQDEKDKTEQRQQFMDDLQNELVGSEDDGTQDSTAADIAESASRMVTKNSKELPSLFEALMTSSYKELLENVGNMQAHQMKRREIAKNYDTEMDDEDSELDEYKDFTLQDADDDHDEDSVNEDDIDRNKKRNKKREEAEEECACCDSAIDMDMVMAEAITKYTVIELFNTLRLETIATDKKKKLIQSLIH